MHDYAMATDKPHEMPTCPTCGQHLYGSDLMKPPELDKEKLHARLKKAAAHAEGNGRGAGGRHYKSGSKGKKLTPIERNYVEGD